MKNYIILLLISLLTLFSCKKDETISPTTTTTQLHSFGKNSLIGYTGGYDYINPDSNVNGGITAKVMSGSTVIAQSITDSTGKFIIDSLEVGTYDIVITKSGWATYKTKSVFCGPGPNPTIVYFENDNPYGYRVNPLVRKVYSDIDTVVLDSLPGTTVGLAYFSMTIDVNNLDDISKIEPLLFDRSNPIESLVYFNTIKKFIPPNKILFAINWHNGQWYGKHKFDFVLSPYLDYVMCGSILNSRGNFEVTNGHKIIKDVTIIFP